MMTDNIYPSLNGTYIIAKAVRDVGIEQVFGIVGVPITNVVVEMQRLGLPFYGFRNEQAAGYAASVVGYLTRRPAVCFTVSGPGMVHALPGAVNAYANSWPMVLMSSSTNLADVERGGFQETPQIECAQLYCKRVYSVPKIELFPAILESAVKESISGRPGPVYIQIPSDVLNSSTNKPMKTLSCPKEYNPASGSFATSPKETLVEALQLITQAKKPVVIGGKGAAYARCEEELAAFVRTAGIPFLSSPMGKGLLPDDDEHVVSPARSVALKGADVVLVIGARLNWMFSYGQPPTFSPNVKFITIDISAEQSSKNITDSLSLVGDAKQILKDMNALLPTMSKPSTSEWWKELKNKMQDNHKSLNNLLSQPQNENDYLTYHQVFNVLRNHLPRNTVLINEGANTMDIGRVCLPQYEARSRLDSGTLSTMGVGVGYAVAASAVYGKSKPVVCVQGDSAFGFSGMEIEVACRFRMPILFVVINNNGIYEGLEATPAEGFSPVTMPPTSLSPKTQYELIIEAFGGKGHGVSTISQLDSVISKTIESIQDQSLIMPVLVNVFIQPSGTTPKILSHK